MKPICIIPARKGSKRIKNKNIKLFAGKPLISYIIQIAKKSKLFSRIIVSTDSKKIANIAKKNGAEVIQHKYGYNNVIIKAKTNIILNLKSFGIKVYSPGARKMYIKAKGPGEIKALNILPCLV